MATPTYTQKDLAQTIWNNGGFGTEKKKPVDPTTTLAFKLDQQRMDTGIITSASYKKGGN